MLLHSSKVPELKEKLPTLVKWPGKNPFLPSSWLGYWHSLKVFLFTVTLIAPLRFVIFTLFLSLGALVCVVIRLGLAPEEAVDRTHWFRGNLLAVFKKMIRTVMFVSGFFSVDVRYPEHDPYVEAGNDPVGIIVSNHVSMWDGVVHGWLFAASFVVKGALFNVPLLGSILLTFDCMGVTRDKDASAKTPRKKKGDKDALTSKFSFRKMKHKFDSKMGTAVQSSVDVSSASQSTSPPTAVDTASDKKLAPRIKRRMSTAQSRREEAAKAMRARGALKEQIRERALDPRFPPLLLFPQGTTSNCKTLTKFFTGAFEPGVPVQPVVLRYDQNINFPLDYLVDSNMASLIYFSMCQFYNSVIIEILPVYVPNEDEKGNPKLFAQNVRRRMLEYLPPGSVTSEHNATDHYLTLWAYEMKHKYRRVTYGIYDELNSVTSQSIYKQVGLHFSLLIAVCDEFRKKVDVHKSGLLTRTEYLALLGFDFEMQQLAMSERQLQASKRQLLATGGGGTLEERLLWMANSVFDVVNSTTTTYWSISEWIVFVACVFVPRNADSLFMLLFRGIAALTPESHLEDGTLTISTEGCTALLATLKRSGRADEELMNEINLIFDLLFEPESFDGTEEKADDFVTYHQFYRRFCSSFYMVRALFIKLLTHFIAFDSSLVKKIIARVE